MIDWQAFKRGEFAVRCDTEDKARALLRECANEGMHWLGTRNPLTSYTRWEENEMDTCYRADIETYNVGYGDGSYFLQKGIPVIDYDQFIYAGKRMGLRRVLSSV